MSLEHTPHDSIRHRIDDLKRRRGWSDDDLARGLGLLQGQTIGNWRDGRCKPSPAFWQRFLQLEQEQRESAAIHAA